MVKLFNKLLARSNSYNYYKSNYELLKKQLDESKAEKSELQNTINIMSSDLKTLQETQNELQKSYHDLKNEIHAIRIQKNLASIKQDSKNGKIINIIFIINFRITVMDNIINLFEKDPQFNPIVVIIPFDTGGFNIFDKGLNKSQLKEYEDNYEYFKEKGFNVIKGYNDKFKVLIDIESELKPDIIFYSSPWEEAFPEQFRIENLPKNVLFCYIPYGIHSSYIVESQFNRELQNKAWKIFYPTRVHKELAAKYSDIGSSNAVMMIP